MKFKIDDPMSAHFDQLGKYTDNDMHNVFAYLETLKVNANFTDDRHRIGTRRPSLRRKASIRKICSTRLRIAGSTFTAITPASGIPALPGLLRKMSASSSRCGASRPARIHPIKASPILANGVLYVTTPDNIWAIDARTAKKLWHYQNPPNNAFHIGHRGAAVYKDTVYLTTPDCHLIALNAKDGKVKWNIVIADSNKGYWSTNAPLIVGNHVMVGRLRRFR